MLNHDEAYSCRKLSASGTVSYRDAAGVRTSSRPLETRLGGASGLPVDDYRAENVQKGMSTWRRELRVGL